MKTDSILAAAALSLLASGCTLGPDFVRPASPTQAYAPLVPSPAPTRSFTAGGEVAADWYTLFHSAALDQLVHAALEGNPSLAAARHGLLAAQYELKAVSGSQLPQIDATGQVGRAHINGSFLYAPTNTIDATGNRFELGPQLAYNIDLFGGTRRLIESQQAATAVARDQALNTYVTLVDQTVITAFDYAATQAQIEVTQALEDELQSQFELTRTLENGGKITRNDTLQARDAAGEPAGNAAPATAAARYLPQRAGAAVWHDARALRAACAVAAGFHAARAAARLAPLRARAPASRRARGRGRAAPGERDDRGRPRPPGSPPSASRPSTRSRPAH
jgi:hypothetical protein